MKIPGLIKIGDLYLDPLEVRAVKFIKGTGKRSGIIISDDAQDTVWIYYGNPVVLQHGSGHTVAAAGGGTSPSTESFSAPFQMSSDVFYPYLTATVDDEEQYIQFLKDLGEAKLEARGVLPRTNA